MDTDLTTNMTNHTVEKVEFEGVLFYFCSSCREIGVEGRKVEDLSHAESILNAYACPPDVSEKQEDMHDSVFFEPENYSLNF